MLITNAVIFTGRTFTSGRMLRLSERRVTEIGEHLTPAAGETVLDLEGQFLLPGFVDVHIHAFRGHDTMQGETAVRAMSRDLAVQGVALFCPTTMSASLEDTRAAILGIRAVMVRPEPQGALVAGAHLEAPFLCEAKAGAQRREFFQDPSWDALMSMTDGRPETVRLLTLAPERPGSEALIRRAVAADIHVSVGHTSADAETVHQAASWGVDHATHLFNAMMPLGHRAPGAPGAALTEDRIFCELICDGVHLHEDVVRLVVRCKGAKKALAITDAMEAAGMPDGLYALGGQAVLVRGGEARLRDGTLAGSVLTMPQALSNLIHLFRLPPEIACAMCTSSPASSIGEKLAGSILPGAPGILTVWTSDWRMVRTID